MTKYDDFLKRLIEEQQQKQNIVKITSLSYMNEIPQQELIGKVIGGSVNVNGKSEVRRTCSLTLVVDKEEKVINEQWALHNKFSLTLGVYNFIDPNYDPIIWFPLGVYIITSFSHSENATSINISISGKDKMCLLDGSISGKFPSAAELDTIEIEKVDDYGNGTGEYEIEKVPLNTLIRQLVHTYAKEPYGNIIINDLPDYGLELMSYRGKEPLYAIVTKNGDGTIDMNQMIMDKDYKVSYVNKENTTIDTTISEISYYNQYKENKDGTEIYISSSKKTYQVMKFEYGDVVGYHKTDLIYAGKLSVNIGASVTSALNKIRDQLGQFEYFYDLNGQFVFQLKKNRLQENFSSITSIGTSIQYVTEDYYSYEFTNKKLFTAISQTPQIANIKNDFTIWGQKQSDTKPLVLFRYAIDEKPTRYKTYTTNKYDWREILYQMACDFYKEDNWSNLTPTGYEAYYPEIYSFWRDIYDPDINEKGWITMEDIEENNALEPDKKRIGLTTIEVPESLRFWIEFLEPTTETLEKISTKTIGNRTWANKENSVTGLYYPQIPEIIYYWRSEFEDDEEGGKTAKEKENEFLNSQAGRAYAKIQLPDTTIDMFSVSARGQSAVEKAQEILNNNIFAANVMNLTSIPIYHLPVNSRVRVDLDDIKGDYVVESLTIPLTYNGTMQISTTKVIDSIY